MPRRKLPTLEIVTTGVSYHRNGTSGNPFHVVEFQFDGRAFVAIRFDKECDKQTGGICCAVVCQDAPTEGWRGDRFAPSVDAAIKDAEERGRG